MWNLVRELKAGKLALDFAQNEENCPKFYFNIFWSK